METTRKQVVRFDARGKPGRNARNGKNGCDGRSGWSGWDGQNGERGEAAGTATPATDSQPNDVVLQAEVGSRRALVRVSGRRGRREIDERVPMEAAGVWINSRGVAGGHGGRGGNGGHGGRGGHGRDASAHSSGGNGGDGGDGGHAGAGSNGEAGGDAARSRVTVNASEAYLLMLVEEQSPGVLNGRISGGQGGDKGAHGIPGRGGSGGLGGSSYTRVVRDSKGNVRNVISRPGGSRGSRGRNGQTPNIRLRDGADGADSGFEVVWIGAGGKRTTYRAGRYDLAISGVEIRSNPERAVDTGLFERDQFLDAWVTLENTNREMPTPDPGLGNLRIVVVLRSHREDLRGAGLDVVGDDSEVMEEAWIEIDEVIRPGASFRLPVPFTFQGRTGVDLPIVGDLPDEHVTVAPRAYLCGRSFVRARRPTPVRLEHVAELTPLEGRRVLAWGDRTMVRFRIENRCKISLGELAEHGRVLNTDIMFGGSDYALGQDDFVYYDEEGAERDISEHLRTEIERLGPGEVRTITGSVQLKATEKTQVPYQSLRLRAALHIGLVNEPLEPFTNQVRFMEIQTVEAFPKPEQYVPHIVFVTNSTTERQEILNRRRVANDLKLLHADFNISYHGELSFDTNPLLTPLRDTTFEIINTTEIGLDGRVRKQRSADILKTDQALRAYREKGIRVFFTGPDSEGTDMALRISPQVAGLDSGEGAEGTGDATVASHNTHKSVDAFFDAWAEGQSSARETAGGKDRIELELVTWWDNPVTREHFVAAVEKIHDRMRRDDLHNRYVLTYAFAPEAPDPTRSWHQRIRGKRRAGSVTITRTTPVNENPLTHLDVPERRLRDPDFVFSFDYLFALMKSLPFAVKLGVLDTLDDEYLQQNVYIDNPDAGHAAYYLKAVYFAILSDLAEEQELLRRDKWRAGISRKELQAGMSKLAALGSYNFQALEPGTPKFELFAKLAAEVGYMIHGQREIVQGYVPGYRLLRRSHTLRRAANPLLERFLENPELVGEKEGEEAFRETFKGRRSDRRRGLVELREHGILDQELDSRQQSKLRDLRRLVIQRDGGKRSYERLLPRELAEAYRSDREVLDPDDPDVVRSRKEADAVQEEQLAFDEDVSDFYQELQARLRIYGMEPAPQEGVEDVDSEWLAGELEAAGIEENVDPIPEELGRERL